MNTAETRKKEALRLSNEESNRLTRECLQTALIYLLNEKSLEEITITELVKRSGVSRTAFYRNYETKEDIIKEITDSVASSIRDSLNNPYYIQNPHQWLVDYFSKAEENAAMISLLLKAIQPGYLPYTPNLLEEMYPQGNTYERYAVTALKGAFSAIFREWFLGGRKETPEEIADICIKILTTDPTI